MMRMSMMEGKKEDDMGACIEKLDKVGWAAQDPMYDTALLLFGQSVDYRKLWLHLKPESYGNWVKSTGEIRVTDDFKEYETVFMNVDVLINQAQSVVSTQGMHRSTPRAHRTPTLTASPQGKRGKQIIGESSSPRKTYKITIKRKKKEETKAESHKENSKNVNDDDEEIEKKKKDEEIEKEKKDEEIEKEKKDDNVEKTDKVVKEKDIVDDVMGSTVSPITTTTSKDFSTIKCKKLHISYMKKIIPGYIAGMCRRRGQIETNDIIREEMPHLVNLAVNKDCEVDHINAHEMIAKEFATHGPNMIEELF
nr:L10-interacting MYB domain-containing protein-like [Tanacetum cinerariifolium]